MSIKNELIDFTWNSRIVAPEGVMVASNHEQEHFLPWWWMNFRLFNNFPVTFVDFGDMSAIARKWCSQRGNLITLGIPDTFIAKKEDVDPKLADLWEKCNSDVWLGRLAWFKKPFALLKSPYQKTVWLDLDCQTKRSIQPLFSNYLEEADIALFPEKEEHQKKFQERGILLPGEKIYNSGVIAFRHGIPLIEEWVKQVFSKSKECENDQEILCKLLSRSNAKLAELPIIYNWFVRDGANPDAVIVHWWGSAKEAIPVFIDQLKQYFFIDLTLTAGV